MEEENKKRKWAAKKQLVGFGIEVELSELVQSAVQKINHNNDPWLSFEKARREVLDVPVEEFVEKKVDFAMLWRMTEKLN